MDFGLGWPLSTVSLLLICFFTFSAVIGWLDKRARTEVTEERGGICVFPQTDIGPQLLGIPGLPSEKKKKKDSSPMSVLSLECAGCWGFFISLICFS